MPDPVPTPAAGTPAFYDAAYAEVASHGDTSFARWRELGGEVKAAHVEALCRQRGLEPDTVLEIGCGDGALLRALARRGVGEVLDGVELSSEAAELAQARRLPAIRRIDVYDGRRVPAAEGAYALVVLSHVLEHVPDPEPVLREAARVGRNVVVEVPLERNRSAARPAKRAEARRIGHVHAFSRAEVRDLCDAAGLDVVAELADPLPLAHHAFFARGAGPRARAFLKTLARRAAFRAAPKAAERLFTVHYACLSVPRTAAGRPSAA